MAEINKVGYEEFSYSQIPAKHYLFTVKFGPLGWCAKVFSLEVMVGDLYIVKPMIETKPPQVMNYSYENVKGMLTNIVYTETDITV